AGARLWLVSALFVGATLCAASAPAATVTNTDDSGPGSLRAAVMNAATGDTITFAVRGQIDLTSGEIPIVVNLSIVGPGPEVVTINTAIGRAFSIAADVEVSISGLRILSGLLPEASNGTNGTPGMQARGGAILNLGTLALSDCAVNGTAPGGEGGEGGPGDPGSMSMPNGGDGGPGGPGGAALGGGIYNGGTLTITDCEIAGTSAGGSGGSGGNGGDGVTDSG